MKTLGRGSLSEIKASSRKESFLKTTGNGESSVQSAGGMSWAFFSDSMPELVMVQETVNGTCLQLRYVSGVILAAYMTGKKYIMEVKRRIMRGPREKKKGIGS